MDWTSTNNSTVSTEPWPHELVDSQCQGAIVKSNPPHLIRTGKPDQHPGWKHKLQSWRKARGWRERKPDSLSGRSFLLALCHSPWQNKVYVSPLNDNESNKWAFFCCYSVSQRECGRWKWPWLPCCKLPVTLLTWYEWWDVYVGKGHAWEPSKGPVRLWSRVKSKSAAAERSAARISPGASENDRRKRLPPGSVIERFNVTFNKPLYENAVKRVQKGKFWMLCVNSLTLGYVLISNRFTPRTQHCKGWIHTRAHGKIAFRSS